MKLAINKFTFKIICYIFIIVKVLSVITSFKLLSLSFNKKANLKFTKDLSHISKYLKLLNNYKNSNKGIDCNLSKSCKDTANELVKYDNILIKIEYIYKILSFDETLKRKFNEDEYNKDLEKEIIDNKSYIKLCYLIKLLNSSESNVFFLYSESMYAYINWITKSKNFKETALNKIMLYKDNNNNNYNYNNNNYSINKHVKILNKFILIIKVINSYIAFYSRHKVTNYETIYRGVCLFKNDPILNKVNDSNFFNIVTSSSPLSFTYEKNVACCFGKNKGLDNKVSVMFEINKTQNCLGKNLDNDMITRYVKEKEYLLKPFSHLKIVSMSNEEDRKLIVLECLKDNEKINNIKNIHIMK